MTDNTKNNIKKSLIDRIDDSLIGFHKKLAIKWMNHTGKSQSQLEKELYYGSAAMLGAYALDSGVYIMLFPASGAALKGALTNFKVDKTKTTDMPKWLNENKFDRYMKLTIYAIGIGEAVTGTIGIVAGAITKEPQAIRTSLDSLAFGVGLISWCSANYIEKAQIEPVKEKSKIDETMFKYK